MRKFCNVGKLDLEKNTSEDRHIENKNEGKKNNNIIKTKTKLKQNKYYKRNESEESKL